VLAAGLVWIRAEHVGAERVGGLNHPCAGNKVGNELARRSPLEIAWRQSDDRGGAVRGRISRELADFRLDAH
jgi:hypothetical protein